MYNASIVYLGAPPYNPAGGALFIVSFNPPKK